MGCVPADSRGDATDTPAAGPGVRDYAAQSDSFFMILVTSPSGWLCRRRSCPVHSVKYAGHSLRAEHATSATIAGASERSIMNQTGHRSVQMVRRYISHGSLFRENSAGKLGL